MCYVVVTGVSTGIGFATTKALITAGYYVFGSVRKEQDIERVRSKFPSSFTPLLFDVTDIEAIREAARQVSALCFADDMSCASGADAINPTNACKAVIKMTAVSALILALLATQSIHLVRCSRHHMATLQPAQLRN